MHVDLLQPKYLLIPASEEAFVFGLYGEVQSDKRVWRVNNDSTLV